VEIICVVRSVLGLIVNLVMCAGLLVVLHRFVHVVG
jgi:hypothetical protein